MRLPILSDRDMLDSPPDSRLFVLVARSADRIGLAEGDCCSLCITLDEERNEENNRDEETENDREESPERHVQPDCASVHGHDTSDGVCELVDHLNGLAPPC